MGVKAVVQYSRSPSQLVRDMTAAAKTGVEEAAAWWDESMLPEHFAPGAAEKYGYAKRSGEGESAMIYSDRGRLVERGGQARRLIKNPKYYHRKRREGFGTTPLVRTGETKRLAIAGGTVKSRRKGDTVEGYDVLPVKRNFYQRPLNSPVDKPKEMTTTTAPERSTLTLVVEKTIQRVLSQRSRG